MAIVKTEKLSKIYNPDTVPVHALRDVTISFEEGEFTSVVGPSGSGKTTLLNMIGGLDKPTSGSVEIDGTTITGMSDREFRTFHRKLVRGSGTGSKFFESFEAMAT